MQQFNSKEDYNIILNNLKKEFEARWSKQEPSPYTNLEGYVQRAVIGNGSFGTVLLVREKTGKNYYAAKMMCKDDLVRLKQINHVHNEKSVLSAVRFPFLVNLIDSTKDFDYLYLVLPFINGGELFTYHRKVRKFNEKQSRFYGCQVLLALEYLHHMTLIYRDLKPENILLDARGYIKLTDFGFTKRVENRTSTLCGTPEYLAPEIIQLKPYNKCVDWWAFGVLLYEFVVGEMRIPSSMTAQMRSLIEGLMQLDPTRRLGNSAEGSSEIKNHAWFQGVDWYMLLNQEINPPYIPTVSNIEDLSNFENSETKSKTKSKINRHSELFKNF